MEISDISKILQKKFQKEPENERKIVFWYDNKGEFKDEIQELQLTDVQIIQIEENNLFNIKYKIFREQRDKNFLLYSSKPQPTPKEDWLYDIYSYSDVFYADKISLIMKEYGIEGEEFKEIVKYYIDKGFFKNKERCRKLKELDIEEWDEKKLRTAPLLVLSGVEFLSSFKIFSKVVSGTISDKNPFEYIQKFGDEKYFYELAKTDLNVKLPEKTVKDILISLFISSVCSQLENKSIPENWKKYYSQSNNVVVFMDKYRNDKDSKNDYVTLADNYETELQIDKIFKNSKIGDYIHCDTFKWFDREVIKYISEKLVYDTGEFNKYRNYIDNRKKLYWYNEFFKNEYSCLEYAIDFLSNVSEIKKVKNLSLENLFKKYSEKLYINDFYYRKFRLFFSNSSDKELFDGLDKKIDNMYVNDFMGDLSIETANSYGKQDHKWGISKINKQWDFYKNFVEEYVKKDDRIFVIISDAFRYECAKEFSEIISKDVNYKKVIRTKLSSMQACLPSITKFGMAVLLPHGDIKFEGKEIYLDKINSNGTENREKILNNYSDKAVAVTYDDLRDKRKADYRKLFQNKKLIYIYHNNIDKIAHSSEYDVFRAVENTFEELKELIINLMDNVSGTNFLITADHGFVYRNMEIKQSELIPLECDKDSFIEYGKKYILSEKPLNIDGSQYFSLDYLFKDTNMEAFIPTGTSFFKLPGERKRFFHGGASLQEIVVPVLSIKYLKNNKKAQRLKKVNVELTSSMRTITNLKFNLDFFQTEKISNVVLQRKLELYFIDENGTIISNRNKLIANVDSDDLEKRKFRISFDMVQRHYSKVNDYYLVMKDPEEKIDKIVRKISFSIDILINNDFGF